eukprot:4036483-Ditylum_brightwellii.AAC.2
MELTGDVFDPWRRQFTSASSQPSSRRGGLGALNPTKEAPRTRATSVECTAHLRKATLDLCVFKTDAHTACLDIGCIAGEKGKEVAYESERQGIKSFYTEDRCRSVERAGKAMNNWLTVVPRTANNTILKKESSGIRC